MTPDHNFIRAHNDYLTPPEEKLRIVDCNECKGEGLLHISNCCGEPLDKETMTCNACKEHCDFATCEECNGKGKVEL